jgi:hypothetical protein
MAQEVAFGSRQPVNQTIGYGTFKGFLIKVVGVFVLDLSNIIKRQYVADVDSNI